MNNSGELYGSTAGTGIYKSTDNGNTWQPINNGLILQQALDVYQTLNVSGNLFAATTDGIYKSTDDGETWVKKSSGITIGGGALYAFTESVFEYQGVLFTGAWNGIYYSTDGAENWNLTNISGEGVEAKNFTVHDGIIFAARESINSPIGYKSFDNGYTWEDLTGLSYFNTITFFSEPGKLWGGLIDGVWLSTDDGITWEDRSNGLSPDPYSSSIIRINGTLVTSLKFGGSGVYKSDDDGLNWQEITDNLPFISSIEKLILYNGKIIAATSDGLWQRDVSGIPVELISFNAESAGSDVRLNWVTATEVNNRGFEVQRSEVGGRRSEVGDRTEWEEIGFVAGSGTTTERRDYSYTDKNISAGTYNYRLKQVDLDGKESYSNEIAVDVNTPAEFLLEQNYPNPFNPSTNIGFKLKSDSKVTLNIYNIVGEEITLLSNENLNAGEHRIHFTASGLTSGIYFYTLKAAGIDGTNFTATRKMILMK
jgi:photosystem II stability/assembly factor-like uncharacterized protein